ncbi:TIM-barrel domain-containing protein [Actinosynnema pretiosum]|uniref:Glycoside hydrolase n=1 Tax=Actinosynnema pretiosum TaxID=42197 RepID=A0A290YYV1_9PSEU|nr:TIM-barrel domain-containing protein [Actinosynnema pretiosum]ATE51961.1 glycoside hydrolase [Actinosynnema pretiosum]
MPRPLLAALLALGTALAGTAALDPPTAEAATGAVVDGNTRFQVLSPTLIRLEHAGDGAFTDATTFNALNRDFPTPPYTTTVSGEYREIRTSALTLRYKRGSGPFTSANTTVQTSVGTGAPAFPSHCAFNTACEAENGLFGGTASAAYDHVGHSGSGFLAGFTGAGASLTHRVSGVPGAGTYELSVRYANAVGGDGQQVTRTLATSVDGVPGPALTLPVTGSWDTWSTASVRITVGAGSRTLRLAQEGGATGNVNLDTVALTPVGAAHPAADTTLLTTAYGAGPKSALGGWARSLDNPRAVPVPLNPGVLNRGGWYLLDDTRTPLSTGPRPSHGDQPYQDGYLFGYGKDHKRALGDLNALTGDSALLPRSAYGVWYSRYHAYSDADYRNTLLPAFRANFAPIDWLVVDTDWKSPAKWDGWNWDRNLFPDPDGFLEWTEQQGLDVSLNTHPAIESDDPAFAEANRVAGGLEHEGGTRYTWDWSNPAHLRSYFGLHEPFERQGVRAWWLDYCTGCGAARASDQGYAADNLINQEYARDAEARGLRGFAFSRIGGAEQGGIQSNYALGPWSERRNTMHFTGDTPGTWELLAFAARFTPDAAAAGLSNTSHDIGSFHGKHLADDLYARWVQLGAFQPIDRLHSDHGDRLPWDYTGAAAEAGLKFLRLREALVPHTYSLARQAARTGVPITRPMYLNYPDHEDAYNHPAQYLFGDDVLVAPITTPDNAAGTGSVDAWIPPGTWTDYFTGARHTGPAKVTLTAPTTEMPVLVRSGGILTTRTDYVHNQGESPLTRLTLTIGSGGDGSTSLYEDEGEGLGHRSGASATTALTWRDATRTLTVGARSGNYPGAVGSRSYTLRLAGATAPTSVAVDGVRLPETAWSFNANTRTTTVTTPALTTTSAHTVALSGSAAGNPTAGRVTGPDGRCLSAQPAGLAACDGSAAQQVSAPTGGTVRALGRCLGTTGTFVTCDGSTGQTWVLRTTGELANRATGACLDATGNRLSACSGVAWRFPPGALTGPGARCADVANADPASGAAVQLWECNGSDAQRWHAPADRTVRALGKCLDVRHGATADGTQVQLWDCNGTGSQLWETQADGALRNPASGRCLDGSDQAQLRIRTCAGTAAQQFRLDA